MTYGVVCVCAGDDEYEEIEEVSDEEADPGLYDHENEELLVLPSSPELEAGVEPQLTEPMEGTSTMEVGVFSSG